MRLRKIDKVLSPLKLLLLTALIAGIITACYFILPIKESNMYSRTKSGDFIYYLESDSMEPEVPKGSRITVRPLEEGDFEEGTVKEGLIVLYEYEGVFYLNKTGRAEYGYLPLIGGSGDTVNTLPSAYAENYIIGKLTGHSRPAGAVIYIFGINKTAFWGLLALCAVTVIYELCIILYFNRNIVYGTAEEFKINRITGDTLDRSPYRTRKDVEEYKIAEGSSYDFEFGDIVRYAGSLKGASSTKRGNNYSFKVGSRCFLLAYENPEADRVTVKCGPNFGEKLCELYPAVQHSKFPHGLLWFTAMPENGKDKKSKLPLELLKQLIDISYAISLKY